MMRHGRVLQLVAFVLMAPMSAAAQQSEPTAVHAACSSAYENAQEERSLGRLQAARMELQGCVQAECPEFMQADCSKWLAEIDTALPSLVFAVRNRGEDLRDVRVRMDGRPLLETLDGAAVVVDPGMHTFQFQVADQAAPITKKLLVLEGEKNRILVIELSELPQTTPPRKAPEREPEPSSSFPHALEIFPYALIGIGALGVAGFSLFGMQGNTREAELEHTCAPRCAEADLDDVRNKWLLADISLGIGLVSLGAGTYLLLSRPAENPQARSQAATQFALHARSNGAFTSVRTSF